MKKERILITGAGGQIGTELSTALRNVYSDCNVFVTDKSVEALRSIKDAGPYAVLDATDGNAVLEVIKANNITQVYHLAALLSATGEREPKYTWDTNMSGLLNILEVSCQEKISKIYWPSSIAAFGPTTPRNNTPQKTIIEPTTMYGISKFSGELLCQYYFKKHGLDIRSLRYPGLISWKTIPGGGTTDYAVEIFYEALKSKSYTCFLSANTYLPMMYMDDAIRGTIELMESPLEKILSRMAYNISAMSFSPEDVAKSIREYIPEFQIKYKPDYRQEIANSWPENIDDTEAREDWEWAHKFNLKDMTRCMLYHLTEKLGTIT